MRTRRRSSVASASVGNGDGGVVIKGFTILGSMSAKDVEG